MPRSCARCRGTPARARAVRLQSCRTKCPCIGSNPTEYRSSTPLGHVLLVLERSSRLHSPLGTAPCGLFHDLGKRCAENVDASLEAAVACLGDSFFTRELRQASPWIAENAEFLQRRRRRSATCSFPWPSAGPFTSVSPTSTPSTDNDCARRLRRASGEVSSRVDIATKGAHRASGDGYRSSLALPSWALPSVLRKTSRAAPTLSKEGVGLGDRQRAAAF